MTQNGMIVHLRELGYSINVTQNRAELIPLVKGAFVPPRTMENLKAVKEALVAYLTCCRGCGRDNGCAEDRDRLKCPFNPFCNMQNCPFRG